MPRMKARDSFYTSDTRQVSAGAEFDIDSDERSKELEARGLAEFVVGSKAESKPLNKAEPAPQNKDEGKSEPVLVRDPKAGEKPAAKHQNKGDAK